MIHFLTSPITIHPLLIISIAIIYTLINLRYRHHFLLRWIHFIPTLLHEFGHAIFCQLTGGKVEDIVIVTTMRERRETKRAGYAITVMHGRFNQFMTLIGGYLFPPLILLAGILCLHYSHPVIFWILMLLIFFYYFVKTSRKGLSLIILIISGIFIYFLMTHPQYQYASLNDVTYQFILSVLLADTLLSSLTITALYFKDHNQDWDGALLSRMTRLPVFIYYLFFLTIHIGASYMAIQLLIGQFS